jgi:hypothetical protein
MTPREHLRALAEALPAGAAVSVPREWLLELLDVANALQTSALPPADLTVADLAARFGRGTSTVRGWLERGFFEGAYKLNSKDWRVPQAAVEAFQERQRGGKQSEGSGLGDRPVGCLGDWRKVRGTA